MRQTHGVKSEDFFSQGSTEVLVNPTESKYISLLSHFECHFQSVLGITIINWQDNILIGHGNSFELVQNLLSFTVQYAPNMTNKSVLPDTSSCPHVIMINNGDAFKVHPDQVDGSVELVGESYFRFSLGNRRRFAGISVIDLQELIIQFLWLYHFLLLIWQIFPLIRNHVESLRILHRYFTSLDIWVVTAAHHVNII